MRMYYSLMCDQIAIGASLLFVYLERDLWDAILYGFTYRFGNITRSINFQLRIQWFSKFCCLCHLARVKFILMLWCAPIALVSLFCLSDTLVMRWSYVECCFCQVQVPAMWSRTRDVPHVLRSHHLRPGGLLVYNCVNNLLHFTQVFNIVISLSSTWH